MVQPVHRVVHNRQQKFKPDVVKTLVYAGNEFKIVKENPEKYAELAMNEEFWDQVKNAKNQELGGNKLKDAENFVRKLQKDEK